MSEEPSMSLLNLFNWKIRPMEETDLTYVETYPGIPYSRSLLTAWLKKDMKEPNIYCRVLTCNGSPVGACVGELRKKIFTDELVGTVVFVYVHPDFRFGMDLVQMLLLDFEAWAKENKAVQTTFTHENTRLASRLGYTFSEATHVKALL